MREQAVRVGGAGAVLGRQILATVRWRKVIETAVRFRLVGVESGSVIGVLELPRSSSIVSFATVGELRAGAVEAGGAEARRGKLERVLRENHLVMTATDAVVHADALLQARFAGRLKDGGVNDMWTAACVLAQPEPVPVC